MGIFKSFPSQHFSLLHKYTHTVIGFSPVSTRLRSSNTFLRSMLKAAFGVFLPLFSPKHLIDGFHANKTTFFFSLGCSVNGYFAIYGYGGFDL